MLCGVLSVTFTFIVLFVTDTATTAIYTLSLHDALPIFGQARPHSGADPEGRAVHAQRPEQVLAQIRPEAHADRKSTRLNSSHSQISYAVFCLKKKKKLISSVQSYGYPTYTNLHADSPAG